MFSCYNIWKPYSCYNKYLVRSVDSSANSFSPKHFGTSPWINIVLEASTIILFILSPIPFYCGVLWANIYLLIPFSSQNFTNSLEVNSPPRSDLKHFKFFPVSFSTKAMNSLNLLNASDFSFRKFYHIILEKSSVKIMKCLSPK